MFGSYNPYDFLQNAPDEYIKQLIENSQNQNQNASLMMSLAQQQSAPQQIAPRGLLEAVPTVEMMKFGGDMEKYKEVVDKGMEAYKKFQEQNKPQQPNQNTTMILSPENSMYADLIRRQRERYGYY